MVETHEATDTPCLPAGWSESIELSPPVATWATVVPAAFALPRLVALALPRVAVAYVCIYCTGWYVCRGCRLRGVQHALMLHPLGWHK